jgi:hypothetical protein
VYQATGREQAAAPLYERALRIKRRLFGAQHADVALTQHNLAGLLASLGQRRRAGTMYRRALSVFAATLGARHASTRACRQSLATLQPPSTPRQRRCTARSPVRCVS